MRLCYFNVTLDTLVDVLWWLRYPALPSRDTNPKTLLYPQCNHVFSRQSWKSEVSSAYVHNELVWIPRHPVEKYPLEMIQLSLAKFKSLAGWLSRLAIQITNIQ